MKLIQKFTEYIKITEGETNTSNDIRSIWSDMYNEDLFKEYPKIAKIVKMHPNTDRHTLARWWQDTYNEDFKSKFPEMWKMLDKDIND